MTTTTPFAFLLLAFLASRATSTADFGSAPGANQTREPRHALRAPDPLRILITVFVQLWHLCGKLTAHVAPSQSIPQPAAAGSDHSGTERAVSSAIPSRLPSATAPALAERPCFHGMRFTFVACRPHPDGRRRWALWAMRVLHAVVGTVVAFRVPAKVFAVVRPEVPEGTSLEAPGRRFRPVPAIGGRF